METATSEMILVSMATTLQPTPSSAQLSFHSVDSRWGSVQDNTSLYRSCTWGQRLSSLLSVIRFSLWLSLSLNHSRAESVRLIGRQGAAALKASDSLSVRGESVSCGQVASRVDRDLLCSFSVCVRGFDPLHISPSVHSGLNTLVHCDVSACN